MSLFPWQQNSWHELVRRHQTAGLPHALLFTGLEGIGKHGLALHAAKWLLCQEEQSGPCGQCHSCRLWDAGSHPDFMLCQPEDGSRQIRIDAVRKVNNFVAQTPQISRCQVVSLRPVEVMNPNAANALLKTLEEPAGACFLLLETERIGSVLPTIRSRCQRFSLHPPAVPEALHWLQQQGFDEPAALRALRANHLAPLKAQHWLTSDQAQQQQRWLELLQQWTQGSAPLNLVAEQWSKYELADVAGWFYSLLADCLKISMGISDTGLVYGEEIHALLGGATPPAAKLLALHDKVKTVLSRLLSGAGSYNKQLLIESLLLEWRELISSPLK